MHQPASCFRCKKVGLRDGAKLRDSGASNTMMHHPADFLLGRRMANRKELAVQLIVRQHQLREVGGELDRPDCWPSIFPITVLPPREPLPWHAASVLSKDGASNSQLLPVRAPCVVQCEEWPGHLVDTSTAFGLLVNGGSWFVTGGLAIEALLLELPPINSLSG